MYTTIAFAWLGIAAFVAAAFNPLTGLIMAILLPVFAIGINEYL